jgi:lipoate-protein ligase A
VTDPADALCCVEAGAAGRFRLTRCEGPAAALVEPPAPELGVRICTATGPALVLGSTQPAGEVARAVATAEGVEICRRRTGGGAVLVEPGAQLWLDAYVPAADPLFEVDVGRAFFWLGSAVARAVTEVTGLASTVHRGPLVRSRWSATLCFTGVGPGEVLVGGRKVLGAAQRRDRGGAWFQAMVLLRFDPAASVRLLALADADRMDALAELQSSAVAVAAPGRDLEQALLLALAGC